MKGPLETCVDKDNSAGDQPRNRSEFSEFMWMAEEGGVDAFDQKCEEEFAAEEFMDIYLQQMLDEEDEEEVPQPRCPDDGGEWWYPPQQQQQQPPKEQQQQQQQQQDDSKSAAADLMDPAVLLASRMQGMQMTVPQQPVTTAQVPVVGASRLNPNAAVFVPRFLQVTADDR